MKQLTQFLLFSLLALLIASCGGDSAQLAGNSGGISGTGDGSGVSALAGASYKGPLIQGSFITVRKVVNGEVTSDQISTRTLSNKGDYTFDVIPDGINNEVVSILASGQFYDENTGVFSSTKVKLFGLAKLDIAVDEQQIIYINSLTHLSHELTLRLLAKSVTYEEATSIAETRVLTLLSALTGERNITQRFNNMSLINTANTSGIDNSFLLYVSALFAQAVKDKQESVPTFRLANLFEILIEDVISNTAIDNDTLELLQGAHDKLDSAAITQNLAAVLVGDDIAVVSRTVIPVTQKLSAPIEFHSGVFGRYRRFCYDGASNCDADIISGTVANNGQYTYELQSSSNKYLTIRTDFTAANHLSISNDDFLTGNWNTRVRKVWPDGQYSKWTEIGFIVP